MVSRVLYFALILLMVAGCKSKQGTVEASTPETTPQSLEINDQVRLAKFAVEPTAEQLRYDMKPGSIDGDSLKVKIKYGGGCGSHTFSLMAEKNTANNWQLWLLHDVKKDPCKAFVIKELAFDLSPLKSDEQSPLTFKLNNEEKAYTYTW